MQLNEHTAYPSESLNTRRTTSACADGDEPTATAVVLGFDNRVRFVLKRDRRQNGDRRASGRGGRRETDQRR
jgi:hypothetical protein